MVSFDIGLNVGFLDGWLNLDIDYYNCLIFDKYVDFIFFLIMGFFFIRNNNGKLCNCGIELQFFGKIMEIRDFIWDVFFNIIYNKNKIIVLFYNKELCNRQEGQQVYIGWKIVNLEIGVFEDEKVWVGGFQEGMEYGVFVGYQVEGIY